MSKKSLEELKNELAEKQMIYEPKYGGKDHSGYDTMMKYEVNYERHEAFIAGFDAAIKAVSESEKKLVEALVEISKLNITGSNVYCSAENAVKTANEALKDYASVKAKL